MKKNIYEITRKRKDSFFSFYPSAFITPKQNIFLLYKINLIFELFSRIPCRGIFSFCGVCFHGGHIDHIRTWFNSHNECPYGCGHRCKSRDAQNRPSRVVSQRFTLKT